MSFKLRYLALLPLLVVAGCQQPANMKAVASESAQVQPIAVNNAWIEISRSALEFNIKKVQNLLGDKSSLCAVLKGDAYGHDLSLVTPIMIENNIQCIGVTNNQELKMVRDLGFKGRLMRVRNATEQEMQQATQYDVEELIGNLDMAQRLNAIAQKQGKTVRIHLALNSGGMSRNGLEVANAAGLNEAKLISQLPQLKIVGIMSHYPEEDALQIKKDLARFNQQSQKVLEMTGLDRKDVTLHVANTFATITVPESWLDMVRVGGIFYGDTIATDEYKRVMTFKSNIASVNHYPKGNTVGYDRTHTLKRDSVLANIPVGYADGYRRVFSNAGYALIGGQRVPVLGKTSMNTVMVDVTDLKQVKPGDEVVFFGKQGNAEVTAEQIEDISGALFTEMSILWGATNQRILVD
ncbi:alanine racemase [Providencia vermicola]|uniref:Broad specificity amino-acid racemase n=1 Tax=Providencia vermicola TaxID=333965 RepID=A0AAX3S2A2_9GAMM|nr:MULTISPECIES: alanine racemase [Providencia]ELX8378251.1 alanine racemase [Providencia stuartii]ELZ5939232.1 alanine racemase [Providencia stuartii]EMD5259067.1 alanine racemase [Providencia stuartii]MBG5918278.1 alanine racemase [Providencia stuartii]MCK1144058.1 alanine racemase [Providencia stuartii]